MTDTTMEKIDILPFRGCKFLCGEVNKIELAIRKGRNWRGHYRYDAANFSLIEYLVSHGDICFDVGANIGVYSNVLARISGDSGNIHSFEPVQHIFKKFKLNSSINGHHAVNANPLALGNEISKMEMYQIKPGLQRAGTSSFQINDNFEEIGIDNFDKVEVDIDTLDHYVESKGISQVDFIKIDVEGFEANVISGGQNTLEQYSPKIMIELDFIRHPKSDVDSLKSIFDRLDYTAFEYTFKKGKLSMTRYNFQDTPKGRNLLLMR